MTLEKHPSTGLPAASTESATDDEIRPQDDPHNGATCAPNGHHVVPHELRNAWLTAKQLEDRLEIAGRLDLSRTARWIREQAFLALLEAEGFVEVPADG